MTKKQIVETTIDRTTAKKVNIIVKNNDIRGSITIDEFKDKITNTLYRINLIYTDELDYIRFISTVDGIHYNKGIAPIVDNRWAEIPLENNIIEKNDCHDELPF